MRAHLSKSPSPPQLPPFAAASIPETVIKGSRRSATYIAGYDPNIPPELVVSNFRFPRDLFVPSTDANITGHDASLADCDVIDDGC
jgi:hypothetical protein